MLRAERVESLEDHQVKSALQNFRLFGGQMVRPFLWTLKR
jgi:hypothetical protein